MISITKEKSLFNKLMMKVMRELLQDKSRGKSFLSGNNLC
jgi:hypothetical protein